MHALIETTKNVDFLLIGKSDCEKKPSKALEYCWNFNPFGKLPKSFFFYFTDFLLLWICNNFKLQRYQQQQQKRVNGFSFFNLK